MISKQSPDWLAVKRRCDEEIALAQVLIESPGFGPVETEFQRGRIAAFREVLKFPDEPKEI